MASLAYFTIPSLSVQTAANAYGITSDVNKFNVSSSFAATGSENVYAMLSGTILLQQQQANANKVNLILRPHNQKDLKLPVKYVIYRGLDILNFLDSNNLSDPVNKVKTSGSELLIKMQAVQTDRAPGVAIPVQALFGNELSPVNTKNIDDFFFKNLAASSQLFIADCGMELGKFASGDVSIEIVLENPEFFINVELAKKAKHEIDITSISDPIQKKWMQDSVRHFVDPAAFYGLHHDLSGGIEYRNPARIVAGTPALVYQNILAKFYTKNKVYLDIRNENGYSYNYYNNYKGTGADALKNIKTGQSAATLIQKEYYSSGWALHVVDITAGTTAENEVFLALRVNDNERPLLAGWNVALTPNTVVDPPTTASSTRRMFFTDETSLIPTGALPDFINPVSFKVPNITGSTPAQLSTIVRLDYIKQLRLNDGADAFPQQNPTDYVFGPLSVEIPWDSEDGVRWIGSGHQKYFDGVAHGVMQLAILYTIASINRTSASHQFIINGTTGNNIINNFVTFKAGNQSLPFNIISITETSGQTIITVKEAIPAVIAAGDNLLIFVDRLAIADYKNQSFIIPDENLTGIAVAGNPVWHHFKLDTDNVNRKYTIDTANFTGGNTVIRVTTPIKKHGFAAMMQTGIVSETNVAVTPVDTDNVILYAVPDYYFLKTGTEDINFFNYRGGTSGSKTFFDEIRKINPRFSISKSAIEITSGVFKNVLIHDIANKIVSTKENILMLAITKMEWSTLLTQSNSPISGRQFSNYHIKVCKLIRQGGLKRSHDFNPYYQYKIVVSGLGTDGNYIQTNEANGIDVYSIDGLVFSSDNYAKTLVTNSPSVIINFKRRSDYKTNGGHYGFDWMRPEFIEETDITNPTTPQTKSGRGGICIPNINSVTKDQAQNALKQEYTPLIINNNDYYMPWLSMYENHATVVADGNPVITNKHEVRLQMELDRRSTSNSGSVTFDVPQGIEIIFQNAAGATVTTPIAVSDINSTIATIKCHQKNNADRKIFIKDERNNVVGGLNILRNNEKYRCDVRFVKFKLRGTLTGFDTITTGLGTIKNKINFTAQTYELTMGPVSAGSGNLNLTQNFNEWKSKINSSEEPAKNLMYQSLIKYNPIKSGGNPDFSREVTIDFGNYTIGTVLPDTTPLNKFKNRLKGVQADGNLIFDDVDVTDTKLVEFINIVNSLYTDNYPNNDESVTVFVFPCDVKGQTESTGTGTAGASNGIDAKCVLLMVRKTLDADKTLVHEISHSLGLPHTFQTGLSGTHTFLEYHTENIMDYKYPVISPGSLVTPPTPVPAYKFVSDYGISYHKWQIETLKQDPDLKPE